MIFLHIVYIVFNYNHCILYITTLLPNELIDSGIKIAGFAQ